MHAPVQTKHIKVRPLVPWYNQDIHAAKQELRKAERQWRHKKLEVHREIFKHRRKKRHCLLFRKQNQSSFSSELEQCASDQKKSFHSCMVCYSVMKQVHITSLLRKPTMDQECMKNIAHAVSNLSFVSKLLEKVVSRR